MKLLALLVMTIDHIGAYLYPDVLVWRAVGRITFPIWFFLVGHALHYRMSRDTFLWALTLAVLSPCLAVPVLPLNALFTILLCQWLLGLVERGQWFERHIGSLLVGSAVFFLPSILLCEYGSIGFLYALMGYAVRTKRIATWQGRAVTFAALMSFSVLTIISFEFTLWQDCMALGGAALVTIGLTRFEHRPVALHARLSRPLMWVSRHSMQYYVVHRLLLQAVGVARGVLPIGLRWI